MRFDIARSYLSRSPWSELIDAGEMTLYDEREGTVAGTLLLPRRMPLEELALHDWMSRLHHGLWEDVETFRRRWEELFAADRGHAPTAGAPN